MPTHLATNRRHREGHEPSLGGNVPIHALDQADPGDLDEVVGRFPTTDEPIGDVVGKGQTLGDDPLSAAAVFAVWLSYVLPMPRADAVATGVLISFALYAGVIVYAFAAHSLRRLWFGVLGFTGFFALAALALRPAGAGW